TLAVGSWNTGPVYVWDVPSEKQLRILREFNCGEPSLVASLSGQLLAGHSLWFQNQVLWHPDTGTALLRMANDHGNLSSSTSGGWIYGWDHTGNTFRLHVVEPSPIFRMLTCNRRVSR